MFSYRHAFHAGNHADVLKHLTLVATLRHLLQKETALTLIDTHAGAGRYALAGREARTSGEADEGIHALLEALQQAGAPPPAAALQDYLDTLAALNAGEVLRHYPGSPLILRHLMRPSAPDRLRLFELHPTDGRLLTSLMKTEAANADIRVVRQDGFDGLRTLLPPPASAGGSRRALVLIDPSYELKPDYSRVATAIQDALKRFPTGCYLIWHPLIARPEAHALPRRLKTLSTQAKRGWLHVTLDIGRGEPATARPGLQASGMFVINPPHTLGTQLNAALPQILNALARGQGKGFKVETGVAST